VGVLVLAALLGVTSLFVDWGGLLASLWQRVAPLDVEAIACDVQAFAPYLTVEGRAKGPGGTSLRLELGRTAAFPTTDEARARAYAEAGSDPAGRLVLDALARGYARAEVFAASGAFLSHADVRISALASEERIVVDVPLPRDPRPARVVLRP
jgi:hypothetical protein